MANSLLPTYLPPGSEFTVHITLDNPEVWDEWLNCPGLFMKYWEDYFREIVFECHRYLIRVTPISTGRLRAGWTGILNKYNQDYQAEMMDTSLVEYVRDYKPNLEAQVEGLSLSQYVDEAFIKTLINNVPYGEYNEWGTSIIAGQFFTHKAMFKSEQIFKDAVENWYKLLTETGRVVEPPPVEVTTV